MFAAIFDKRVQCTRRRALRRRIAFALPIAMGLSACSALLPGDQNQPGGDIIFNIRELTGLFDPTPPVDTPPDKPPVDTPPDQPPTDTPPPTLDNDPIIQFIDVPQIVVDTQRIPDGPRHFLMGAVPIGAPSPKLTDQDLIDAINFTGTTAECFVIRQKIDWEAFRPGGNATPDFTLSIFDLIESSRRAGFTTSIIELDPIVDRHNIGPLPPAIADKNFGDIEVRTALKRQAIEVAVNVRPTYLSFAVEANGYFESNPEDFANFVSLHKELYDEIKALTPEVQIMASFNLEAIQGRLAGVGEFSNHGPQWFLIDMFEPKIDAIAFSTLPFPVFFEPLQMPENYISQISDFTDLPIVLSEVGWTTAESENSSDQLQLEYLSLMLRQAERTPNLRVFAWTILYDAVDGSIFDLFPAFKFLGLLTSDGTPKPSFDIWNRRFNDGLDTPLPPEVQAVLDAKNGLDGADSEVAGAGSGAP